MKRFLLALLALVVVLAFPRSAYAECYTIEDAPLDADCVVMPYGAQRGVWFRLDRADELRRVSLEAVELRTLAENQGRLLEERTAQVVLLRSAADQRKAAVSELSEMNERLVKMERESREEALRAKREIRKWYRSPFLWFGAGVAVSAGTTLAVVLSTR